MTNNNNNRFHFDFSLLQSAPLMMSVWFFFDFIAHFYYCFQLFSNRYTVVEQTICIRVSTRVLWKLGFILYLQFLIARFCCFEALVCLRTFVLFFNFFFIEVLLWIGVFAFKYDLLVCDLLPIANKFTMLRYSSQCVYLYAVHFIT